jgi:hypothetical protein
VPLRLVGSEMCIRDRSQANNTNRQTRLTKASDRQVEERSGLEKRERSLNMTEIIVGLAKKTAKIASSC